jgi:hypothetical protein
MDHKATWPRPTHAKLSEVQELCAGSIPALCRRACGDSRVSMQANKGFAVPKMASFDTISACDRGNCISDTSSVTARSSCRQDIFCCCRSFSMTATSLGLRLGAASLPLSPSLRGRTMCVGTKEACNRIYFLTCRLEIPAKY